MLRYRAASFFGRLYCPEILNGMYSEDEITDMKSAENMTATDIFAEPEVFPEEPAKGEEMEITQEMEDAANAYFEAHEQ